MELQLSNVDRWKLEFQVFCDRFMKAFGRSEVKDQTYHYLQGLLSQSERKTPWQISEITGQQNPQAAQRLLRTAIIDLKAAEKVEQKIARETFESQEGIFIVDESGVAKKGDLSVGVARQYCGNLGKMENCQVGVFLSYASEHGHVLLDRRLYLPQCWIDDSERRAKAGVPEDVIFKTKPQLAQEMIEEISKQGFLGEWVTGDAIYGNSPELRNRLIDLKKSSFSPSAQIYMYGHAGLQ